MLSIAKLADHRCGYYFADLGDDLRLLAPSRVVEGGRWVGDGSAALGLKGSIDPSTLSAALAARHPATGRPLVLRQRTVVALDLTFAAPKSVSLLFGLGSTGVAEHVVDAHRSAVDAALGHLQRRAWAARRATDEGRAPVATDGLVGAAFTHGLSRAGDPHLHTHVVAANLAHGEDGRWSALDTRGPFAHARAAGALYEAHLRAELSERLGIGWSWSEGRGWDVAGVEPSTRAAFSGRAAEIREHVAARGLRSAAARRVAWAATRPPKDPGRSLDELRTAWRGRLRDAPRWAPERNADRTTQLDEHRFAASMASCSESGACRRDVVVAWSDALATGARGPDVEESIEHWAPASRHSIGVGEPRVAPSDYVPGSDVLRLLGSRPADPGGQPIWRHAADEIDRHRERWGTTISGFDCGRAELAGMGPELLADHLELSRTVREALASLDRGTRTRREAAGIELGR